jgi:hypothetical protein
MPEIVRSWPAIAVETSSSAATDGSTGESTSTAACDAARHRNRVALVDPGERIRR